MKNCTDYIENISALIDGELSESERVKLEVHLTICDNCSAIYELYKEMSQGIDESCVEPPESLCENVMTAVRAQGGTPFTNGKANNKKKSNPIIYLKRYLPAVACLAVILIALPFVMNERTRNDEFAAPVPAGAPAPGGAAPAAMEAFSEMTAPEADADYDGAPIAPRMAAETFVYGELFGGLEDDESGDMPVMAGGGAPDDTRTGAVYDEPDADFGRDMPTQYAEAVPAPHAPELAPLPEEAPPESQGDIITAPDGEIIDRQLWGIDEYGRVVIGGEPSPDDMDRVAGMMNELIAELTVLGDLISETYIIIDITGGELPHSIAQYEYEVPGELMVWAWDSVFRIPRSLAQELMLELEGRDGVQITHMNNPDSDFAVVIFYR